MLSLNKQYCLQCQLFVILRGEAVLRYLIRSTLCHYTFHLVVGMQEHQANIVVVPCILRITVSLWKYHFFVALRASAKDHLVARKRMIFAGSLCCCSFFFDPVSTNHKHIVLTARTWTRSQFCEAELKDYTHITAKGKPQVGWHGSCDSNF